ncbi:SNF2 family N-terminal domain-containing protein [Podospora appendiculata]|uniref:SNF2 family N-terminal domain-containing protein n=1 Tax=Podospora appendiculata TaxID=314037 RepID=A0AAE0WYN1_9PEZI|nr:SNF2 family N-terminal domain-containing protein [Podospora appendiculata]KAK3685924.1 SNF2 family N-terminal domain-containing protein [Podospora appendiculata]
MPSMKVVSRRPKLPVFVESEPGNIAALLGLVQSIPIYSKDDAADNEAVDPSPAKRPRTERKPAAICIARENLTLLASAATILSENSVVSRQNVGKFVALALGKSDLHNPAQCDWHLWITPRAKSRTIPWFRLGYTIRKDDLTPKLAAALHTAATQGFDPGQEGCIWAAIGISIRQDGAASAKITLAIELRWNESATAWGNQSTPQQALRNALIANWYPELQLHEGARSVSATWSPQVFYEAAHVPEKQAIDAELSSMDVPHLRARLFPFQRRAVQWLLQREGAQWCNTSEQGDGRVQPYVPCRSSEPPISFVKVEDADGTTFHLSPLFGIVTRDYSLFRLSENIRGGVLAEEMGLGKTVEITALILLHQRPEGPPHVYDPFLGQQLRATPATLIVAPSSLLDQWLSELRKHAPELRVLYYPGLKKAAKTKVEEEELVADMATQDVVITTYEILRTELWSAFDKPERSTRSLRQLERRKSPLVQLSWWRVCIDEAQMVENWTNNAAKLAKIIPRINAWCITGTPVKDDVEKDLRGLLTFLRFEPYASDTKVWKLLTTGDKQSFSKLFNMISMRHTKSLVRREITIPPQRRYVITMPFSAVEEQHYQSLFKDLAASCGLDPRGNPVQEDWNPDDPSVQYAMRVALDRLRQTALHPEVGNRNRRALGQKIGPMRTVEEVLNAMLEQSDGAMRTDQRNLLALRLTRGQILAGLQRPRDALEVWEEVRAKTSDIVAECRNQLEHETKEAQKAGKRLSDEADNDEREDGVSARIGEARRRLRSALEIQHRAVFFCSNAYFSIKSNADLAEPGSEEFKQLEKLEIEGYDLARAIRNEILQESYGKAKELMGRLEKYAEQQLFAVIPVSKSVDQNGLESRRIADGLEQLGMALDDQSDQLNDWREHVIQLLLKPLVDEENDDVTGEEYQESTKLQDEIVVYLQVLRAAVADRQAVISGQQNNLAEHEAKVAIQFAKGGEGPSPEKLLELFEIRDQIRPPFTEGDPLSSLRGLISELRGLSAKLRHDVTAGSGRATAELAIASTLLKVIQQQQTEQAKVAATMEQEVESFTDTLNARLEFYRQLQSVSDMVAEYEGAVDDAALATALRHEQTMQTKLATSESKHRYLLHLKEADTSLEEQKLCIICQSTFTIGVLTVCGHKFCKSCITQWFRAHHNCPMCKRKLQPSNLHDITLKPQGLKVRSESDPGGGNSPSQTQHAHTKKVPGIYTEFSPEKLAEIKNIELEGPCFTTKVDTLIRHILWLRMSDPGAKSIVFSQYKEFLDVLAVAFRRYRIGCTSFEKAHGITTFKEDPGTEVFLLHARAHASGLNLVNASHVFLCEPLVNTALELQAIARVDRIGQQHETTVWLYIVDGTVEESIYNLSVQRRLEHMGQSSSKGKSKEAAAAAAADQLEAGLDEANSLEMQQAQLSKLMGKDVSGEAVDKKDLWTCLFGNAARSSLEQEERLVSNPATRAFLAAEAAEERQRIEAVVTGQTDG